MLDLGANGHIFGSKDGFSSGAFIYYVDANNLKKDIGAFVEVLPSRVFAVVSIFLMLNAKGNLNLLIWNFLNYFY